MVLQKTSQEIKLNLDFLIHSGKAILEEGMNNSPSFNPSRSYEEKNRYFDQANNVGLNLMNSGMYDLSERYYEEMLNTISNFEQNSKKSFNKGMVYANLGVSQIASDKIDQGMANLLNAYREDAPFHNNNYEPAFLDSSLYKQFEGNVVEYLKNKAQLFASQESTTIDKPFIENILSSFDVDDRLLLMATIWNLRRNFDILSRNDNTFVRSRLFSIIKDFCLFVENIIRKEVQPTGSMGLKCLIDTLFALDPLNNIINQKWRILASANNICEFESNLKSIDGENNVVVKRFLFLGLVRNFSGHHFDTSGTFFFTHFEEIFQHILGVVLYLKHLGKI